MERLEQKKWLLAVRNGVYFVLCGRTLNCKNKTEISEKAEEAERYFG